jgi:Cu2+-exporting ATPase
LLPEIADSEFHIGYGITVNIEGHVIRVGSQRFMELEQVSISTSLLEVLNHSHAEGHSIIMVSVDEQVQGALEMHATVRPEVKKLIQQLRQRGIKHLAIVSGDHQNPTRKLAEELGMDSYFYDILPEDKARIVSELKRQNRSVCFIGDGVNDAIAMKEANISISLSGATSIATDVAQIVLMDGTLNHLADLFEISSSLERNLQNSLIINLVPGAITVASAYIFRIDVLVAMLISQLGLLVGLGNAMIPLKQFETEEKTDILNQTRRQRQFDKLHEEQQGELHYT